MENPELADAFECFEFSKAEDSSCVYLNLKADIKPQPSNLDRYLLMIELYAKTEKWLKTAGNIRVQQMKDECDEIVDSTKPEGIM